MSSPSKDNEEPSSSSAAVKNGSDGEGASAEGPRPPAKRRFSSTVIEISDTESDDSDVCAVKSYQASADEVKRIRGEYSSDSSSSDYSSDSESSPWEDDSIVLEDKAEHKVVKAHLYPRANRMDDPKLNPALKSQEVTDRLTEHWRGSKDLSSPEATLMCEPFRLCLLHGLLANSEFINNIVDDMNTLDWSRKKMDLYEFHQTADLASLTWQRSIRGIYELLEKELMGWVSSVTGLELTSVSASCSLYGPGDHLLVHDDMLADRRVAFILYLAPWQPPPPPPPPAPRWPSDQPAENGAGDADHNHDHVTDVDAAVEQSVCGSGWLPHMGGALELLAHEGAAPGAVRRRVFPANNMLAFFQVGPHSFHQVGEVLSLELPRLSINGWFHGPAPPAPAAPAAADTPAAPPAPLLQPLRPHSEIVLIAQWLEPTYMSPRSRVQIQAQMERESEVCLRDLLQPARHRQLLDALRRPDVPWEAVGPSNRRHYSRVPAGWVAAGEAGEAGVAGEGHPVRALLRLVSAGAWLRVLADCTDLQLATYHRLELQRWAPGDYTLLPPREQYAAARLEALLYLGVPARALSGGCTCYVAPEDAPAPDHAPDDSDGAAGEGALVTLPPVDNALSLVYCDAGTAAFTKYVSRLSLRPDEHFYILTCTYNE